MNTIITVTSRLKNFPISFFSIMLGLLGFTIANQKAVEILNILYNISAGLIWISALVFLVLLITYLAKFVKFPQEIKKEFNHPVKMNF